MNRYAEQLRDELVGAAIQQHRARRRRRAVVSAGAGFVAVAGVAAVLIGIFGGSGEDTATATDVVRATRTEDATFVEILEPERPVDVLENLRSLGLDAERHDRSTGPSKVGDVVSVAVIGNAPSTDSTAGLLSAHVERGAKVVIGVGVETPPGGLYEIGTDAFADGEPLWCLSWPGQSTNELAVVAAERSLNVRVIDQIGPVETLPRDRTVVAATAVAADRIIVLVGDGAPTGAPAMCAGSGSG